MTRPLRLLLLAIVLGTTGNAIVLAQPPPLPPVVVDERLERPSAVLTFAAASGIAVQHPIAVRLELPASAIHPGPPDRVFGERMRAYGAAGIRVWLAVGIPAAAADVDPWRAALRRILQEYGSQLSVVEVQTGAADSGLALYALRVAATEARSTPRSVPVAISGRLARVPEAQDSTRVTEVAPYIDLLAVGAEDDLGASRAWLQAVEPDAKVLLTGVELADAPEAAARECAGHVAWSVGTAVAARAVRGTPEALRVCLAALDRAGLLLGGAITELDPAAAALTLSRDGRDITAQTRHRVLFEERTSSTLLVIDPGPSNEPIDASLRVAVEGKPVALDLQTGRRTPLSEVRREEATAQVSGRLPPTPHLTLVNFSEGASEVFSDRTGVTAEQPLTVEQIVARHQQRQNVEDQALHSYIADVRMSQHFRPTMTDPGYDVVTENRYYVDTSGVEWEELSFSVNGSKWGADRPPFPLLQPEKVLSLPLQLRFGDDYQYKLQGVETVDGVECHVVAFEPARGDSALYSGTVWIDRRTFAKVQVRTVQAGMPAPVASNEETHRYRTLTTPAGQPVTLLSTLSAQQILMIAGRNILLEKRVTFDRFQLNTPGFLDARAEARSSDRIMYRDTDAGVRYYVKEGGERVVSDRQTLGVKALAMGTLLDPSYSFPLPIFGINYLDFEFGSPDTQLAVLFGGVLAAVNIQRAKLGRTPLDGSIDFFGIAVPSTDRVFDGSREREEQRLLTWPLTAGANVGWQYTPYQKVTAQYQFRYDAFVRERTTAESFRLPSSTMTHGFGAAWEFKRGGYSFQANGTWYGRGDWDAWGAEGADEASDRTYVKYTASVSRDFYIGPFQKLHLNAAWFGGLRLDRFSRYQFGLFDDTRIHGVPAAGIRFDDLRVARGSYSFNLLDQYRFDLFLDQGWGRDRSRTDKWRPLTGIGVAFNVRTPWSTILRVDVGKSFLPEEYSGQGSATAQIMLMKPLR